MTGVVVYGAGLNSFHHLDTSDPEFHPLEWQSDENDQILQVACGLHYSLARTSQGTVYHWGMLNAQIFPQPARVSFPQQEHIVLIACGRKHALALTVSGQVFAWGNGLYGQLGLSSKVENLHDVSSPTRINRLCEEEVQDRIISVSCGGFHCGALTANGRAYLWGLNVYNQVHPSRAEKIPYPFLYPFDERVVISLALGRRHTGFLCDGGSVLTFGCGDMGQLGHSHDRHIVHNPTPIERFENLRVNQLVSGDFHVLALTECSKVYSFGSSVDGQSGHGDTLEYWRPHKIFSLDSYKIVKVAAGPWTSFAIAADGKVFGWGCNDTGSLGIGKVDQIGAYRTTQLDLFDSRHNELMPRHIATLSGKSVTDVSCGATHTLALIRESKRNSGDIATSTVATEALPIPSARKAIEDAAAVDRVFSFCRNGRYRQVVHAIENGFDLSRRDQQGNTLLLVAAQNNQQAVVKLCVEQYNADVNATNNRGQTGLHYCFAYGFLDLATLLIELGADDTIANDAGLTCYEGLRMEDLRNFD